MADTKITDCVKFKVEMGDDIIVEVDGPYLSARVRDGERIMTIPIIGVVTASKLAEAMAKASLEYLNRTENGS